MERPSAIFWDIENCQPPKGLSVVDCATRIRDATSAYGEFRAYCDVKRVSDQRRQECQRAGVVLVDVPSRKANAADLQLQNGIMEYVMNLKQQGSSGAVIVLVSGDIDFAPVGLLLKRHDFEFVLVHNQQANRDLIRAASSCFSFEEVVSHGMTTTTSLPLVVTKPKKEKKKKPTRSGSVAGEGRLETLECGVCHRMFNCRMSLLQHHNAKHLGSLRAFDAPRAEGTVQRNEQRTRCKALLSLFHSNWDASHVEKAALLLCMLKRDGIAPPSLRNVPTDERRQCLLGAFCLKELELARYLLIDPEDVNYSGTSNLYVAEDYYEYDAEYITPLTVACRMDDEEAVAFLLEYRELDPNLTRSDGKAPIHIACDHGNEAIVSFLISDCDVDVGQLIKSVETYGRPQFTLEHQTTPLIMAVRRGHASIVKLLLRGWRAYEHQEDVVGWRPVSLAFVQALRAVESDTRKKEHLEIVEMLCPSLCKWGALVPRTVGTNGVLIPELPHCLLAHGPFSVERMFWKPRTAGFGSVIGVPGIFCVTRVSKTWWRS